VQPWEQARKSGSAAKRAVRNRKSCKELGRVVAHPEPQVNPAQSGKKWFRERHKLERLLTFLERPHLICPQNSVTSHSAYCRSNRHDREREMTNVRVLRDIAARKGVKAHEVVRRAYLYCARNQTLEPQVRYQAQLQLNNFGRYSRPTTVRSRCTVSGKGRGIITEFGLCRYQFRLKALDGELPGVFKASW